MATYELILPEEPRTTAVVWDKDGYRWERIPWTHGHRWMITDGAVCDWSELVRSYGPLTDEDSKK